MVFYLVIITMADVILWTIVQIFFIAELEVHVLCMEIQKLLFREQEEE